MNLVEQLDAENWTLGKPEWKPMLRYVAALHERATLPARPPFQFPWEEIGPGYASSPAFGHWDIVHQILDVLPWAPEHARHQILNNLTCQQPDGFLPGTIWMKSGEARWSTLAGHPPVWPVAVDEWTRFTGSGELMEYCFEPLLRQIGWFENNRTAEPHGFFYTDISIRRWESGVDEGIRFDEVAPGKYACMDATAHGYQLYSYAASWAKVLGRPWEELSAKASALRGFIQDELFDDGTGWFFDIWAMRDASRRRLALEGMWPLVVGAARPEQAERVIANLTDPDRFLTAHPPSTVAVHESCFELRLWRGPAWNSMTYWAARGCSRYGRPDAAASLLELALDATHRHFQRTGTVWEFYHPFGGEPEVLARKPDTEFNTPFPDYLGHNPLLAMARLYDAARAQLSRAEVAKPGGGQAYA